MIERNPFFPADCIVAAGTVGSELTLVNIVVCMAACASHRKLHDAGRLFMTGVADQWLVRTAQREPSHRVVVKAALLPVAAIVAANAIGAVVALVDIVLHMTGDASTRRLSDRVADAVAGGAASRSMLADQRKTGVGVVIEGGCLPACRRMAT